jgi:lysophospholipase L1-like esterase
MGTTPNFDWDELSAASPADVPYRVNILAGQVDATMEEVDGRARGAVGKNEAQDIRLTDLESWNADQETRLETDESLLEDHTAKLAAQDTTLAAHDTKLADHESWLQDKDTADAEADTRITAVEEFAADLGAAGPLTGAAALTNPDVAFSITDAAGRRSWLEVGTNGGPTPEAAAAIGRALPALPAPTPALVDETAVYAVTDMSGRRSWLEVGTNGGPTPHTVEMLKAAGMVTGAGAGNAVLEADLDPGLAARIPAAFTLADSKIAEARALTVRDAAGNLRPLTANPLQVSFWGDSLFDGYPVGPFNANQSDSLPGVFATLYPAATVYNGGESGQSADEIAIRQGGIVPMLTVTGGSIPASGGVTVTTAGTIGWRLDRPIVEVTGTLAGVPGTLTRSGSVLTFTRTSTGTAVPVAGAAPWESFGRAYAGGLQIIMAGRNDIGYASPAGSIIDRVVTATAAMVGALTPARPRVLLLGATTSTAETIGTQGYTDVTGINTALKAMFPQFFWDYRAWLVKEAIYELGITPTAGDLAQIAGDTLPSSIMTDPVHYSPATAAKAAARIKTELTNRGWI